MLLTSIQNSYGQKYFSVIDELKTELDNPELSADDRALFNTEIAYFKASVVTMLDKVSAKFISQSESVGKQALDIYKLEIGDRINPTLQRAKERMARISNQLTEVSKTKESYVQQRDTLIMAQDVIRETNLADIFQTYLPDSAALDGLNLTNPKKEAIKQAIQLVKKLLGVLSTAIKYSELATARNNLDKEIDKLTQAIAGLNSERKLAEDTLGDVLAVGEVNQLRMVALKEIDLVASIWKQSTMSLGILKNSDFTKDDVAALLNRYKVHLEVFSSDYHNVLLT
ncbi:hypothetical protein EAH78_31585 [Pseudomonas arsenicoxydans]|uniref:Alpha-xenorhabdolysin family binary toxin subunit B n=2 Tax=Pseudomonas arsenicoxydans TaxID=702115 RepID=A0A502GTY7_9PSED|nr:hypothetical protein EAH78_31585 [Pseudomonas arsenicoxydans]